MNFSPCSQILANQSFPRPTEFLLPTTRAIRLIDQIVVQEMGGRLDGNNWVIPNAGSGIKKVAKEKTVPPWTIIEDTDKRWKYDGFKTQERQWSASGATLTCGKSGSTAQITFTGTTVQYYAYRDADRGSVTVYLDGNTKGTYSLKSREPQYYVKIWEESGLTKGSHVLRIVADESNAPVTIDMLQVKEGEKTKVDSIRRQPAGLGFQGQSSVQDGLDERVGQPPLEKPDQRNRHHEILGCLFELNHLMRNARPKHRQPSRRNGHSFPSQQIGQGPSLQQVQLDLIVAV